MAIQTNKRRTYKLESEDAIQATFFQWLDTQTAKHPELELFFAIPNGGFRHVTTAMRLKRTGVKAGVLDTFLPVPRGAFHGLWIEFKTEKGKPTESQLVWMARLTDQGYCVHIARSWEAAAGHTIAYLNL